MGRRGGLVSSLARVCDDGHGGGAASRGVGVFERPAVRTHMSYVAHIGFESMGAGAPASAAVQGTGSWNFDGPQRRVGAR